MHRSAATHDRDAPSFVVSPKKSMMPARVSAPVSGGLTSLKETDEKSNETIPKAVFPQRSRTMVRTTTCGCPLLPVPGVVKDAKVGRYRLEEIVYSSKQTVKAA